jgi:hypothetical protein
MTEARRGRRGFGDEDEEVGDKLVDVGAGAELGEFGGEVFRVVLQPLGHVEQSGSRKQIWERASRTAPALKV